MEYFGASNKGQIRKNNEDSFHAGNRLFIVADGMGGHLAGEVASRLSVETFVKNFTNRTSSIKRTLIDSINAANNKVYSESISNPEYAGMGTTFTACFAVPGVAHIVHVGDSRLYLCRNDHIKLITSDHTIVGEMYRKGEITYEDTYDHPQRNYLTNVLGASDSVESDYIEINTAMGDRLILCTDGLNSMLKDDEIFRISYKYSEPVHAVSKLIAKANDRGGKDNITVVVVDF